MRKRRSLLIFLLAAVLVLALAACSENILPPKETETSVQTPKPKPTPTPTPMPSPFTGKILAVEINQALSFGVESNTGGIYPISDLVARRDTAVFVRLSEKLGHVPDERDYLEVYRDGALCGTHAPHELSTEDSLCYVLSGEEAAALVSGVYEFRATVDGQTHSRSAELKNTREVRVLMVPVLGNFGGGSRYPAEGWQDYLWHLQACWPLANDGLVAVTAQGLDLSSDNYDLSQGVGMWRAWEALRERAGLLGDYDLIVGLVSGGMGEGGSCDSFGRNGVVLINSSQSAPEAAITHFAGHVFGAGDEYENGYFALDANPAPYGVKGVDAATGAECSAAFRGVEPAAEHGLYCGGSVVQAEQIPLDIPHLRLLGDAASFMGDAKEQTQNYWITSALWEHLFDALQLQEAAQNENTLPAGSTHWLRVSGLLGQDGSRILREPLEVASVAAGFTDWNTASGSYKLSFADGAGRILRSFWFDLDYLCLTDPPTTRSLAPFDLVVPVPAGASLLQIYGSLTAGDGTVNEAALLHESRLEAAEFTSAFASVPASEELRGIVRVAWTTVTGSPESDAQKDEDAQKQDLLRPYYELYMSYGGTQLLVYRGEMTSAELDMLSLPKPERFALTLLTCVGGRSSLTVSEALQFPA